MKNYHLPIDFFVVNDKNTHYNFSHIAYTQASEWFNINLKQIDYFDKDEIINLFKKNNFYDFWNIDFYDLHYIENSQRDTQENIDDTNNNKRIILTYKFDDKKRNLDLKYNIPSVEFAYNYFLKKWEFNIKNCFLFPMGYDYEGDFIPIVYDLHILNKLSNSKKLKDKIKAFFLGIKIKFLLKSDNRLNYCILFNLPLHKL